MEIHNPFGARQSSLERSPFQCAGLRWERKGGGSRIDGWCWVGRGRSLGAAI